MGYLYLSVDRQGVVKQLHFHRGSDGKFVERQDEWERKYAGPFLVIAMPLTVTVGLHSQVNNSFCNTIFP